MHKKEKQQNLYNQRPHANKTKNPSELNSTPQVNICINIVKRYAIIF